MDSQLENAKKQAVSFRKLAEKFYEISDAAAPGTHMDMDIAHHVLDATRSGGCGTENYAEVVGYHIRREMKALWSPDYIEWAEGLLEMLSANSESAYDLRGHKKNTHTVN